MFEEKPAVITAGFFYGGKKTVKTCEWFTNYLLVLVGDLW